MREYERDRLRMLVLNQLGELLRIGFTEMIEFETGPPDGFGQPLEKLFRRGRAVGFGQHLFGVIEAALDVELLGIGLQHEVLENLFHLFRSDAFESGNGAGDQVGIFFRDVLEDFGAFDRPQGDQYDRSLLQA